MAQKLYNLITATANPTTVTLTQDNEGRNSGQDVMVLDVDMTLGSVTVNLPSLTSVFFSTNSSGFGNGTGATMYKIQGTIFAGAFPRVLTLSAFNTGGDTDTICGDASVTITGVGASFILWVAGRHNWGITVCNTGTIS